MYLMLTHDQVAEGRWVATVKFDGVVGVERTIGDDADDPQMCDYSDRHVWWLPDDASGPDIAARIAEGAPWVVQVGDTGDGVALTWAATADPRSVVARRARQAHANGRRIRQEQEVTSW